MTDSCSVVMTI